MAESSKKEGKKKEKSNVFPNKRRQRLIVAGAFLAKRDIKKKSPPVSTSKQSLTKFKAPTGKSKLLAEVRVAHSSILYIHFGRPPPLPPIVQWPADEFASVLLIC